VSKNYLTDGEIKELNRILLDIFEDQLDLGRLIVLADAHGSWISSQANSGASS